MAYRTLELRKQKHIAYLTLARPDQGNLINERMLYDLEAACEDLADDEETRVAILSAQGQAFCLGWEAGDAMALQDIRKVAGGFNRLARLPQPVIAAVNGDALSAGLELALACDLRIASEGARFGLPEVSMGLIPLAGGSQRLPRLIGRAKALEMLLTGETLDAQAALQVGLINRMATRSELMAETETLAMRIAERGPLALRFAKEAIQKGMEMPLEQALRLETDLTIILQTTEDRAEGVRAFFEKRPPQFHGR